MLALTWLKREIPKWREHGWVDERGMRLILAHYERRSSFGVALIFSLFGALLLLLGTVLIIAHNWEMLGRFERSMLALFLILLGQCAGMYGYFRARTRLAWRESLGIVWFFSIGASIAIIGQTYHLGGEFADLLTLWLLLALPIPIILDSKATAILVLVINVVYFLIEEHSSRMALMSGAFLLWIFYYVWRLRFPVERLANTYLGYALALALLVLVLHYKISPTLFESFDAVNAMANYLFFIAILYMLGRLLHEDTSILYRPFEAVGFVLLYLSLFFMISFDFWVDWDEGEYIKYSKFYIYLILYMLIGFLSLRDSLEGLFLKLIPILYIFSVEIAARYSPMIAMITWNFMLVCGAVYMILLGAKKGSMSLINQGGAILIIGILIKFFESEFSMIGRGAAFIILGGLFLLLLRLSRRLEKRS
ncbi:MAG: DUF2157 domain-containing protein [Wolinella sp.]